MKLSLLALLLLTVLLIFMVGCLVWHCAREDRKRGEKMMHRKLEKAYTLIQHSMFISNRRIEEDVADLFVKIKESENSDLRRNSINGYGYSTPSHIQKTEQPLHSPLTKKKIARNRVKSMVGEYSPSLQRILSFSPSNKGGLEKIKNAANKASYQSPIKTKKRVRINL